MFLRINMVIAFHTIHDVLPVNDKSMENYSSSVQTKDKGQLLLELQQQLNDANKKIVKLENELSIHVKVEERFNSVYRKLLKYIEQTSLAFVEWNSNFKIKRWNKAATALSGYNAEFALGKDIHTLLLNDENQKSTFELFNKVLIGKQSKSFIRSLSTANGIQKSCVWFNTCLEDNHGRVMSVATFIQDLSEHFAEHHELRLKERQLRLLFDNMSNGFLLYEAMQGPSHEVIDFVCLNINTAALHFLGPDKDVSHYVGRTLKESNVFEGMDVFKTYKDVALAGKVAHFEYFSERRALHIEISLYQPRYGQVAVILNNISTAKKAHAKIREQYDEIFTQHEQLQAYAAKVEKANAEINAQKRIIELKNKHITDSINYAHQIQRALLPSDETVECILPGSYIYYKPKDIISGDFYWLYKFGSKIVFALADCTGHGVPAALVSMIGIEMLNTIVRVHGITRPDEILLHLKDYFKRKLGNNESLMYTGMDIAICTYDSRRESLQFSGANQNLYYVHEHEVKRIPGEKISLSSHQQLGKESFVLNEVFIQSPTFVYLASDGFEDQLGGLKISKFGRKRFEKLLLDIHSLPPERQQYIIDLKLKSWMENYEQIDDVTVIGVPFTNIAL